MTQLVTDRIMTLTVATTDVRHDQHAVLQHLNEIAVDLDKAHDFDYITVSSVRPSNLDEEDPGCDHEKLTYDDQTIKKVFEAIKEGLSHLAADDHMMANNVLLGLQNAGILFRERA